MKKIFTYILLVLSITGVSQNTKTKSDSVVKKKIYSWGLNDNYADTTNIKIDTLPNLFQIYNPAYRNRTSVTFLGNTGQANISNNFFDNNRSSFLFLDNFMPYLYSPSNTQYYNTKRHFTNFTYFTNLFNKKKYEQVVQVVHTQNINKDFNTGVRFNVISAYGQYIYQQTRDYSVNVFSSYIINRYSSYMSLNFNKFKINENGGIVSDADVTDSLLRPDNINVQMTTAKSTFTNRNIQLVQRINFGNKDSIAINDSTNSYNYHNSLIYVFNYDYYKKLYSDDNPSFYNINYFDTLATLDSTGLEIVSNYIQFRKDEKNIFNTGAFVQFSNDIKSYHSYSSTDELNYNYITAGLFNTTNKSINWNLNGKYFIDGYYKDDYTFKGEINKYFYNKNDSSGKEYSCLSLYGKYYNQSPDLFEKKYFSNHIKWENNFTKLNGYLIQLNYSYPKYYINAGVYFTSINNYIYYDSIALPSQSSSNLMIFSPYISKTFVFGNWHFVNTAFYQNINNTDILRLPEIAVYHSTYYQFYLVKNVLLTNIGVDVYYNTQYYGYSYMPATNAFYTQNAKTVGNYPYLNFYINCKVQTFRFYFKVEHINYKLIKPNIFTVVNYPMNPILFKFGLSWSFYD